MTSFFFDCMLRNMRITSRIDYSLSIDSIIEDYTFVKHTISLFLHEKNCHAPHMTVVAVHTLTGCSQ